jgi:ATP-dependent protease ClpP protease subunit
MAQNEILIYGTIGDCCFWDEDFVTARQVREELARMSGDITVRINSGGGNAAEGQAIYTALVDHAGKVTVIVDGVAASAASLIAMAGEEIIMRLGAWMLIHDPSQPWTEGRGTEEDHRKEAEALGIIGNAYADIYARRAGISRDEARKVMKEETYLDGQMAVDMGFATSLDTQTEAVAAARFDYRIYAHAPETLRAASKHFGRVPEQEAVMAMIAGRNPAPRPSKGGPVMAAKKETAAPDAAEEEAVVEEITTDIDPTDEPAAPAATAKASPVVAERTRTRRILEMSALANMDATFAQQHIEKGTSAEVVLDLVMAKRRETADMDEPMAGQPTTRILRDERDTRRTAMTQALVAQLQRKAPESDAARPYMDKSLVEMAAISIDHKGAIRSAGDKIEVFMNASHSRSDFTGIFENALNKTLLDRYTVAAPTYKAISRQRNFRDFRVHPMVRPGDFPKLQPISENGEIKFGTFGEKRETAILSSYGVGLRISRQMMIDDDLGAIDEVIGDYGSSVADFEEETFYAFMASATLASDGVAVYHASHNNLAGAGTAITVAALGAGRAAIRKQTTIDGKKMNMAPSILLVGPDKETEADQLVTSIVPNQPSSVNPFSGRLQVVSSAQITGNTWHLFADPNRAGGACFVHGFLDGAAAPRIRTDEPFGQQGWAMTVEHDFGIGAVDFRGTWKNPGA